MSDDDDDEEAEEFCICLTLRYPLQWITLYPAVVRPAFRFASTHFILKVIHLKSKQNKRKTRNLFGHNVNIL